MDLIPFKIYCMRHINERSFSSHFVANCNYQRNKILFWLKQISKLCSRIVHSQTIPIYNVTFYLNKRIYVMYTLQIWFRSKIESNIEYNTNKHNYILQFRYFQYSLSVHPVVANINDDTGNKRATQRKLSFLQHDCPECVCMQKHLPCFANCVGKSTVWSTYCFFSTNTLFHVYTVKFPRFGWFQKTASLSVLFSRSFVSFSFKTILYSMFFFQKWNRLGNFDKIWERNGTIQKGKTRHGWILKTASFILNFYVKSPIAILHSRFESIHAIFIH